MTVRVPVIDGGTETNWRQPRPQRFTLRTGRLQELPEGLELPALQKLMRDYRARVGAERQLARAKDEAEIELGRAKAADLDAAAAAVRAGKPHPGTPPTDAATARLEQINREIQASVRARALMDDEARAVLKREGPAFAAAIERQKRAELDVLAEAAATSVTAYDHLSELDRVLGWLTGLSLPGMDARVSEGLSAIRRDIQRRTRRDNGHETD